MGTQVGRVVNVGLTEGEVFVVLNPDLAGIVPGWEVENAQLCGKLQASWQCLSDNDAVDKVGTCDRMTIKTVCHAVKEQAKKLQHMQLNPLLPMQLTKH